MSDRTFGVEIEHCNDPDDVQEALERKFPAIPGDVWCVYDDGSGAEVHTPALQGEEGFSLLREIFTFLRDDLGGYTTGEDGMHVHLGAKDMTDNPPILARLVRSWMNLEDTINRFIDPPRRNANYWACASFKSAAASDMPKRIREAGKKEGATTMGRRKLNIDGPLNAINYRRQTREGSLGYPYRGRSVPTVEYRLHEGTLDFKEAEAWIRFLLLFTDYHVDRPSLPVLKRTTTLLERVGLPDPYASVLLAKEERFSKGYVGYDEMDAPQGYDYDPYW